MEKKILEVLDLIRPYINMDGGDIEFLKYENKHVYIKLTGACSSCMFADNTINNYIEEALKEEIPEIESVIKVEN